MISREKFFLSNGYFLHVYGEITSNNKAYIVLEQFEINDKLKLFNISRYDMKDDNIIEENITIKIFHNKNLKKNNCDIVLLVYGDFGSEKNKLLTILVVSFSKEDNLFKINNISNCLIEDIPSLNNSELDNLLVEIINNEYIVYYLSFYDSSTSLENGLILTIIKNFKKHKILLDKLSHEENPNYSKISSCKIIYSETLQLNINNSIVLLIVQFRTKNRIFLRSFYIDSKSLLSVKCNFEKLFGIYNDISFNTPKNSPLMIQNQFLQFYSTKSKSLLTVKQIDLIDVNVSNIKFYFGINQSVHLNGECLMFFTQKGDNLSTIISLKNGKIKFKQTYQIKYEYMRVFNFNELNGYNLKQTFYEKSCVPIKNKEIFLVFKLANSNSYQVYLLKNNSTFLKDEFKNILYFTGDYLKVYEKSQFNFFILMDYKMNEHQKIPALAYIKNVNIHTTCESISTYSDIFLTNKLLQLEVMNNLTDKMRIIDYLLENAILELNIRKSFIKRIEKNLNDQCVIFDFRKLGSVCLFDSNINEMKPQLLGIKFLILSKNLLIRIF